MNARHLTAAFAVALVLAAAGAGLAAEKKAAPKAKEHAVAIKGMKFVPETLEVAVGDVVVWTNEDMFPHNVTGGPLASPTLAPGVTWRWTAEAPGELPYSCTLHVVMKGLIKVESKGRE